MRILIVDDHPAFRGGLREIVRRIDPGAEIREAGDIAGALGQARLAGGDLDLVTVDLKIPDARGLSGLRAIRAALPLVPAVVISMDEDAAAGQAVLGAGAAGFISKAADEEAIAGALREVLAGGCPVLQAPESPACAVRLTPRQRDVLGLVRKGLTNKEIAASLGIAVSTVQIHVSSILRVLGLENRTQAAVAQLPLSVSDR
jgi:DNA-binding NarL/FixJ family response regulator